MTPMAHAQRLRLLCAAGVLAAAAQSARAETACAGTGPEARKRMSRDEVRACVERLVWIEHAIVRGEDVVDALGRSRGSVRIRASVIENGLDFSALPAVRIGDVPGPLGDRLRKFPMYQPLDKEALDNVYIVDSMLKLHNTRILAGPRYDDEEYSPVALSANRVVFAREVDLLGSTVEGSARFYRAAFLGRAVFDGVRFDHRVNFRGAWLDIGSFGGAHFRGTPLFAYCRFRRTANFRGARFERGPIFDKARLCGEARFGETMLGAGTRFVGARLAADLDFLDVDLPHGADFSAARFAKAVRLSRVKGGGILTFAKAKIGALEIGSPDYRTRVDAELDFSDARIARASLREVRMNAPVSFARAEMGPAGFSVDRRDFEPGSQGTAAREDCPRETANARIEGAEADIELRGVSFSAPVGFEGSQLQGHVTFERVTFGGGADFAGVEFVGPSGGGPFLRLAEVDLANVNIDWASLPDDPMSFQRKEKDLLASELFGRLEERYLDRRRLSDALQARRARRWASVREARACLFASPRDCDRSLLESLWRAAAYPVWGVVSGFGTSLWRLLLVIAGLALAFAAAYYRFGKVIQRTDAAEGADGMRLRPLAVPATFAPAGRVEGSWTTLKSMRAAIALSTVVLLRFGRRDLQVRGSLGRLRLRHLVVVEWLIGIPLLVDLIYTLTETQPFLQRLITGAIG